ncbi:MAG: hypothetical protein LBR48_00050 [Dysgonamonadaceae bacterium]|jgi:hypothetical protein|nr:hypothetical protein [Dysgonamonadaceae bacterium]
MTDNKKKSNNNELLIKELSSYYPGSSLAKELSRTLKWSSDAVYRRIRGEVPFTFDEVILIARDLRISLDSLTTKNDATNNNVVFTVNPECLHLNGNQFQHNDTLSRYYENLKILYDRCGELTKDKSDNTSIKLAYNFIPSTFYLKYPVLKQFLLFKWIYQYDKKFSLKSMSQLKIKEDTVALNFDRQSILQSFMRSEYVLDRSVFRSVVDDIIYFVRVGLITAAELTSLKKALLSMISEIEQIAISGFLPSGNKIDIYISQIDFHFSYAQVMSDSSEYSFIRMYPFNYLYTSDPRICRMHRENIESLMKYSTLVSHSNEIYRVVYFREQRQIVENITANL